MGLYPKTDYASTYDIPFRDYYEKGFRGIIFDVDNTLVEHGAPADEKSVQLFAALRDIGFDTCILSNNKEDRVKPYADNVGSKYVHYAGKPSRKGYEKAMKLMGTDTESTLFIGDQIFTDIWGANRAGIYSVLVGKIGADPEIQIVLKRILEKPVLFLYRLRKRNST